MKIHYSFVEFHSPVFTHGKNHGTKVHANDKTGIKLYYDTELGFMCMEYKGKITDLDTFHSGDRIQEQEKTIPSAIVKNKSSSKQLNAQGE